MLGAEADDILDEKFVNKKKQEDESLENFREEYRFEEIKDKRKTLPMLLIFCH